jgi:hypothetical protein
MGKLWGTTVVQQFEESALKIRLWALVRLMRRIPPPAVDPAQALLIAKELLRGQGWHLRELELRVVERPRVWMIHVKSPRLHSPFRVTICNRTGKVVDTDFDLADLRGKEDR